MQGYVNRDINLHFDLVHSTKQITYFRLATKNFDGKDTKYYVLGHL